MKFTPHYVVSGLKTMLGIQLQISEQPGLSLIFGQMKTLSRIGEGLAEIKKDCFDHDRYRLNLAYSKIMVRSRWNQSLPHLEK